MGVFLLLWMPGYQWDTSGITLNKWRPLGETNVKWKNCWVARANNKAISCILAVVRHTFLYHKVAHINEFLKLNTVQASCKASGQETPGQPWDI